LRGADLAGCHGTPEVAEFASAELGGGLGISSYAARDLMADALDLVHRFPQLWVRVQALEVRASYARFVARESRDLTLEQAMYVDERRVKAVLILAHPAHACQLLAAYAQWRDRPAEATAPPRQDSDQPVIDWSALLPQVQLFGHTYRGYDDAGVVRVEELGR